MNTVQRLKSTLNRVILPILLLAPVIVGAVRPTQDTRPPGVVILVSNNPWGDSVTLFMDFLRCSNVAGLIDELMSTSKIWWITFISLVATEISSAKMKGIPKNVKDNNPKKK